MNCLCCGKPLHSGDESGWHKACIKKFFGTNRLPEIEIDDKTLELLAIETTNKGFTVPGVQKKLSLHLLSDSSNPRLTLVNYPTGYILKPQVAEYEALPESEQLVMSMADAAGISTVPHGLIRSGDGLAYITKRVDRKLDKGKTGMLAMEDFCQLDLRLTEDKYKGSYERCAKIIEKYSSRSGIDMAEFYIRVVFSFKRLSDVPCRALQLCCGNTDIAAPLSHRRDIAPSTPAVPFLFFYILLDQVLLYLF